MSLATDAFEINTDAALVDPDWEAFVERHDERYGLAIHHLKSLVKGRRFDNDAMKLRVGPNGFYLQSRRFPAAFYGATDHADVAFVSEDEARSLVWEATALYRSGDAQSLTCVYDDDDPPDVFFGYRIGTNERYELGELQGGLPLHARVMIDALEPSDLVHERQGTLVYQRTTDGRHVVLRRSGRRRPFHPFGTIHD